MVSELLKKQAYIRQVIINEQWLILRVSVILFTDRVFQIYSIQLQVKRQVLHAISSAIYLSQGKLTVIFIRKNLSIQIFTSSRRLKRNTQNLLIKIYHLQPKVDFIKLFTIARQARSPTKGQYLQKKKTKQNKSVT